MDKPLSVQTSPDKNLSPAHIDGENPLNNNEDEGYGGNSDIQAYDGEESRSHYSPESLRHSAGIEEAQDGSAKKVEHYD